MEKKIALFRESLKLVWRSAPGWTLANIVISLMRSFLPLALIWMLKGLIDGLTIAATSSASDSIEKVTGLIIAVVILWFLDEAAADLGTFVRKKQAVLLESYMYGLLHAKAVKLDLINFERPEFYDCLSRASGEAPWRPNSILNNLISMFRGLLSLLLMAGLLITLNWLPAVLLIAVNIPAIWLRLHYSGVLYNFHRKQTPEARKAAYFNWLLTGDRPSREIRLFGLGDYFISLFKRSFKKTKEEELIIVRKRTAIELLADIIKASAVLFMLLYIARRTINGSITLGEMAMFLLAFRQGMIYMKDLFNSVAGLYEDGLFIGNTFEFLNLKETIRQITPAIEPLFRKNITLNNLSFTYPGNQVKTIDNISLDISKGEVIALVGSNGAGKSTLARLLCRLYDPASGSVKMDGIDIKNFDPDKYRRLFSVVFQDFMLYNLSAGENVRLGNIDEERAEEKIHEAARETGVNELIRNLPNGYSTVIGNLFDDSRELSWGEWQKIALARALFRDAPLLILDEPSSALDADTEYDIFSRFREIVKGRTAILISHRFTNVSLADRIVVMEKGSVVEAGRHDELMAKRGIYYNMYTKQSSRFEK